MILGGSGTGGRSVTPARATDGSASHPANPAAPAASAPAIVMARGSSWTRSSTRTPARTCPSCT